VTDVCYIIKHFHVKCICFSTWFICKWGICVVFFIIFVYFQSCVCVNASLPAFEHMVELWDLSLLSLLMFPISSQRRCHPNVTAVKWGGGVDQDRGGVCGFPWFFSLSCSGIFVMRPTKTHHGHSKSSTFVFREGGAWHWDMGKPSFFLITT